MTTYQTARGGTVRDRKRSGEARALVISRRTIRAHKRALVPLDLEALQAELHEAQR